MTREASLFLAQCVAVSEANSRSSGQLWGFRE
jgi:hypothetical protein